MKYSFVCLQKDIENLCKYIVNNKNTKSFINNVQKNKSNHQQEALGLDFNNVDIRIFEYNCYIISLYGYFEQFIESILAEYIDDISSLHQNYQELPRGIKINNIKKSAELLNNLDLPKYKSLNANIIIKTLNENIENNSTKINTEAFSHHSANFRINTINDLFKTVGVPQIGKDICAYLPLKETLHAENPHYQCLDLKQIFVIIDDLAERRNHIAHGVISDNILEPDALLNTSKFISEFSQALNDHLHSLVLSRIVDENELTPNIKYVKLEMIAVYNNEILCVNSSGNNFEIGSEMIVTSNNAPYTKQVKIIGIEVNRKSVTHISSNESLDIGLRVNKKIKNTNLFYLLDNSF